MRPCLRRSAGAQEATLSESDEACVDRNTKLALLQRLSLRHKAGVRVGGLDVLGLVGRAVRGRCVGTALDVEQNALAHR